MSEPTNPAPEPQKLKPTDEEIAIARARMTQPYPRRFFTSEEVQDTLRALEAEKVRNPAFGPDDLPAFLARHHATRSAHYDLADGTVVTVMPEERS